MRITSTELCILFLLLGEYNCQQPECITIPRNRNLPYATDWTELYSSSFYIIQKTLNQGSKKYILNDKRLFLSTFIHLFLYDWNYSKHYLTWLNKIRRKKNTTVPKPDRELLHYIKTGCFVFFLLLLNS